MKPNWSPENVGKKCGYHHCAWPPPTAICSVTILFLLCSLHSSADIALYQYSYEELKEVFDALIQYVTSLKTKEDTSATATAVMHPTATTTTTTTSSTTTTTTGAVVLPLSSTEDGIPLTNDCIFSSNEQDEELEVEEAQQQPEIDEE